MRPLYTRRMVLGGIAASTVSAILAACSGGTAATTTPVPAPTNTPMGAAVSPTAAPTGTPTQATEQPTPTTGATATSMVTSEATIAPSATAAPRATNTVAPTLAPTATTATTPSTAASPAAIIYMGSPMSGNAGMVYALTNQEADNQIAIFSRRADGKLTFERLVSTGGKGVGEQEDGEGLGSQGAVLLSPNGKFLYAVNGGTRDISVFSAQDAGLSVIQKIGSNGPRPISLTMHGTILYALNYSRQQLGNGNITAFTVGTDGKLTPLANSTRPLSSNGNTDPGQVLFNPKGDLLVVTEKATNKLVSYTVGTNGIASAPIMVASGGEAPFSFAYISDTLLVTADNFGDAENKGAASSFSIMARGVLRLVSKAVPDKQTGACWITISKDGKYAWVVNTGAATISAYQIDARGNLTLATPDGITVRLGTKPRDIAPSADGKYVYVLNSGEGTVEGFTVQPNGKLESLGEAGKFPAPGGHGLAAR